MVLKNSTILGLASFRALPPAGALLFALWLPGTAAAQLLQVGLAGWPGVGMQVNYVDLHTLYTLETALQADFDPFVSRHTLRVAGSVGAAILPLSIWRAIGQADYGYDLDLGVRFGPRLVFVENATRADKNKQFSLFIDPFLRFRRRMGQSGRFFYLEVGPVRPVFRAGFWFGI